VKVEVGVQVRVKRIEVGGNMSRRIGVGESE